MKFRRDAIDLRHYFSLNPQVTDEWREFLEERNTLRAGITEVGGRLYQNADTLTYDELQAVIRDFSKTIETSDDLTSSLWTSQLPDAVSFREYMERHLTLETLVQSVPELLPFKEIDENFFKLTPKERVLSFVDWVISQLEEIEEIEKQVKAEGGRFSFANEFSSRVSGIMLAYPVQARSIRRSTYVLDPRHDQFTFSSKGGYRSGSSLNDDPGLFWEIISGEPDPFDAKREGYEAFLWFRTVLLRLEEQRDEEEAQTEVLQKWQEIRAVLTDEPYHKDKMALHVLPQDDVIDDPVVSAFFEGPFARFLSALNTNPQTYIESPQYAADIAKMQSYVGEHPESFAALNPYLSKYSGDDFLQIMASWKSYDSFSRFVQINWRLFAVLGYEVATQTVMASENSSNQRQFFIFYRVDRRVPFAARVPRTEASARTSYLVRTPINVDDLRLLIAAEEKQGLSLRFHVEDSFQVRPYFADAHKLYKERSHPLNPVFRKLDDNSLEHFRDVQVELAENLRAFQFLNWQADFKGSIYTGDPTKLLFSVYHSSDPIVATLIIIAWYYSLDAVAQVSVSEFFDSLFGTLRIKEASSITNRRSELFVNYEDEDVVSDWVSVLNSDMSEVLERLNAALIKNGDQIQPSIQVLPVFMENESLLNGESEGAYKIFEGVRANRQPADFLDDLAQVAQEESYGDGISIKHLTRFRRRFSDFKKQLKEADSDFNGSLSYQELLAGNFTRPVEALLKKLLERRSRYFRRDIDLNALFAQMNLENAIQFSGDSEDNVASVRMAQSFKFSGARQQFDYDNFQLFPTDVLLRFVKECHDTSALNVIYHSLFVQNPDLSKDLFLKALAAWESGSGEYMGRQVEWFDVIMPFRLWVGSYDSEVDAAVNRIANDSEDLLGLKDYLKGREYLSAVWSVHEDILPWNLFAEAYEIEKDIIESVWKKSKTTQDAVRQRYSGGSGTMKEEGLSEETVASYASYQVFMRVSQIMRSFYLMRQDADFDELKENLASLGFLDDEKAQLLIDLATDQVSNWTDEQALRAIRLIIDWYLECEELYKLSGVYVSQITWILGKVRKILNSHPGLSDLGSELYEKIDQMVMGHQVQSMNLGEKTMVAYFQIVWENRHVPVYQKRLQKVLTERRSRSARLHMYTAVVLAGVEDPSDVLQVLQDEFGLSLPLCMEFLYAGAQHHVLRPPIFKTYPDEYVLQQTLPRMFKVIDEAELSDWEDYHWVRHTGRPKDPASGLSGLISKSQIDLFYMMMALSDSEKAAEFLDWATPHHKTYRFSNRKSRFGSTVMQAVYKDHYAPETSPEFLPNIEAFLSSDFQKSQKGYSVHVFEAIVYPERSLDFVFAQSSRFHQEFVPDEIGEDAANLTRTEVIAQNGYVMRFIDYRQEAYDMTLTICKGLLNNQVSEEKRQEILQWGREVIKDEELRPLDREVLQLVLACAGDEESKDKFYQFVQSKKKQEELFASLSLLERALPLQHKRVRRSGDSLANYSVDLGEYYKLAYYVSVHLDPERGLLRSKIPNFVADKPESKFAMIENRHPNPDVKGVGVIHLDDLGLVEIEYAQTNNFHPTAVAQVLGGEGYAFAVDYKKPVFGQIAKIFEKILEISDADPDLKNINMSFGLPASLLSRGLLDDLYATDASVLRLREIIDTLDERGVLVFVSAGNTGGASSGAASHAGVANLLGLISPKIVVVGSYQHGGDYSSAGDVLSFDDFRLAKHSARGGSLIHSDLLGLGAGWVFHAETDSGFALGQKGTSFASPYVAKIDAIVARIHPGLTGTQRMIIHKGISERLFGIAMADQGAGVIQAARTFFVSWYLRPGVRCRKRTKALAKELGVEHEWRELRSLARQIRKELNSKALNPNFAEYGDV